MAAKQVLWLMLAVAMAITGCKKEPAPTPPGPQGQAPTAPEPTPSQPGPTAARPTTPESPAAAPAAGGWSVEKIATVETGLVAPESILPDPTTGQIFVSNIDTQTQGYWEADGRGFISLLNPDGSIKTLRWLESRPDAELNAPKGMCVLNGKLYMADITTLKRCDAATGQNPEHTKLSGRQLNDVATDGSVVWVSDTAGGKLFKVSPSEGLSEVKSPPSPNGVTCWQGKVFAVSWGAHDIYEIDPTGQQDPVPFGLAEHFKTLDGIEVLDDGTFIVSDFEGGKVCAVSPDRKTVTTLAELTTPADIGVDRKAGLLFVPQLTVNKAVIYKLIKN